MTFWKEYFTPEGVPYYVNSKTQESTWDKPDELQTTADKDLSGEWFWAPHDIDGYIPVKKVRTNADGSQVVQTEAGHNITIPRGTTLIPLDRSSLKKNWDDLVQMDSIDEGMIVNNLRQRFKQDIIYTNIGTILISVNPFKPLGIFTPLYMERYNHRGIRTLPPHIYQIADDAYRGMTEEKHNQSILISGESGAGKTEATKQVLAYLAEIAGSVNGVEENILLANPILESFGNAKTLRNNNSSRFGKWVEILFDKQGRICGAKTQNYLLEKSRVVFQAEGERNYHVFYQMTSGANADMRKRFSLDSPKGYRYLTKGQCTSIEGTNDASEFGVVTDALSKLGVTGQDQNLIFQLLAGILHLGNLEFKPKEKQGSNIANPQVLKVAASLLGVAEGGLLAAVTNRTMKVKGQDSTMIPLDPEKASDNRDALAKKIFGNLFDWLVQRINKSVQPPKTGSQGLIGVLDIFGFEIFEVNSFEQLCINYANEKLQQHFNAHTFKLEEELYQAERIKFFHVEFIDNQPCLDLIESKPAGILPMMDEEIVMPKGSDESLLAKMHQKYDKKHERYTRPVKMANVFCIKHYAGEVIYLVTGFLEKNKDTLQEDLLILVSESELSFLRGLFPADELAQRKASLGNQFKSDLSALMTTLNSTDPHYVRCVKPNSEKLPERFDGMMSLLQLRYSGVFEAVRIRQTGYPFRWTHAEFIKRYGLLNKTVKRGQPLEMCKQIINSLKGDFSEMQFGVSRILYRAGTHRKLELLRNIEIEKRVIILQAANRGWRSRKLVARMRQVRPILRAAIASRDLAKLEAALEKASDVYFEMKEIRDAKKTRDIILEERRITQALQALEGKDPDQYYDQLNDLVTQADGINFRSPLIDRTKRTLLEVKERREILAGLKLAVENYDKDSLEGLLSRAKKYPVLDTHADVRKAKEVLARLEEEIQHIQKLETEMGRGNCANRDHSTIQIAGLQKEIDAASKFKMQSPNGIQTLEWSRIILSLRQALTADDYDNLEQILVKADKAKLKNAEIVDARNELSHKAAADSVAQKLNDATNAFDDFTLELELEKADALGMGQDDRYAYYVEKGRELLAKIKDARSWLAAGMGNVDEEQLVYALQVCENMGYETEEVHQARTLLSDLRVAKKESQDSLQYLDRDLMESALLKADKIRFKAPQIEEIRKYIHHTPLDQFLKLQVDHAKSRSDLPRLIKATIALQDWSFQQHGAEHYNLNRFEGLRTPQQYASASWKPFGKDELKSNMLFWSKNSIPTSLTKLEGPAVKVALKIFKGMLGWAGEKTYQYPATLAEEIVTTGISQREIRDEVYCQLMKQLTNNPNPASEGKLWQLMSVCVQTFAPSDEFLNYLEVFLRRYAKRAGNAEPTDYVPWLHRTFYGSSVGAAGFNEVSNRQRSQSVDYHRHVMGGLSNMPQIRSSPYPPQDSAYVPPPARQAAAGYDVYSKGASSQGGSVRVKTENTGLQKSGKGGAAQATSPIATVVPTTNASQTGTATRYNATSEQTARMRGPSMAYAYMQRPPSILPQEADELPPPPPPSRFVTALYDYTSYDETIISFRAGDRVAVLEEDPNGWWYGTLNGKSGFFPSNYFE